MAYADEDEVDWSDSSLCALPPPSTIEAAAGPSNLDQHGQAGCNRGSMLRSGIDEELIIPCELPLGSSILNSNSTSQDPSHTNGARNDVLPTRRASKKDYSNFILYEASQKAYELTSLNAFVAHALHPKQIAQCSGEGNCAQPTMEDYMRTVTRDITHITKKIVRNTHCRTVHLLANDKKQGAPFLDVYKINSEAFSDYGPDNLFPVADRVSTLWHRASQKPSMVRLSTDDYSLDHGVDPLEEIEEVTNTLLKGNCHKTLPAGRAVRLPTFKKQRGERSYGAAVREKPVVAPRGDWLAFPQYSLPVVNRPTNKPIHKSDTQNSLQLLPRLSASHHVQDGDHPAGLFVEPAEYQHDMAQPPLSQFEELLGSDEDGILDINFANSPALTEDIAHTEKVNTWRSKLVKDYKQWLERRRGYPLQTNDRAVMSTGEAVAAAIALGFRPTNSDYQEQVDEAGDDNTIVPTIEIPTNPPSTRRPAKKRRIMEEAAGGQPTATVFIKQKTMSAKSSNKSVMNPRPQALHPSGSWTLEDHQEIPPTAYFEPMSIDEKPAWRCGINHALGSYYNAGDCKSCKGCNTNVRDSPVNIMDFFMPSRTYFYQPVPDNHWKPTKPLKKARKASSICHNAKAKDAYWEAIDAGATHDEARQVAADTVVEWLKPKPKPLPKTPTPELEPEPEPDLGPHTSGSTTMEHGQEIPDGSYWEKEDKHEEYAWRCDVGHAFGRYYLAGDKKSCPGCGSSKQGMGKRATMDFYLPPGAVVRQEAPGLSTWKPRALKPGKVFKSKIGPVTHNQMCSKVYHEMIAHENGTEEAFELALMETESSDTRQYGGKTLAGSETTSVLAKRKADDMDEEGADEEEEEYHTSGYASSPQMGGGIDDTSSDDDEESSGSDSE
ncbi:hypothetical protein Alg130_06422 [Pyrenophora tritici-repentis]|nr:hypothetical protein Alg130_06422 [Pyrenophora tritici-repentis]